MLHAIKAYDQRRDTSKWLESDADEQLIIKIPFTGSIKLKVRKQYGDVYRCLSGNHPGAVRRLFWLCTTCSHCCSYALT